MIEMHKCPGWAFSDCPHDAWVLDEDGEHKDLDRCPLCDFREKRWEAQLRSNGERVEDQTEPPIGARHVFEVMLRIVE